jgi:predicted ester cyclase
MTPDEHKALARRFFEEVWNQQKPEVIDEIFAPTVLFNGRPVARDTLKQMVAGRRAAFPDIHVTVEDQVAEGDKVSTRRTWQATHQGPYRGIPATGKRITWSQITHRAVRGWEGRGGLGRRRRASASSSSSASWLGDRTPSFRRAANFSGMRFGVGPTFGVRGGQG